MKWNGGRAPPAGGCRPNGAKTVPGTGSRPASTSLTGSPEPGVLWQLLLFLCWATSNQCAAWFTIQNKTWEGDGEESGGEHIASFQSLFSLTNNKTWSCSIWSRCIALSGKNVSLLEMLPLHTCLREILLNYYSPILIKYMTKQQKHTIDILIQNTVFQCLPKSIFDIINYLLLRGHYDFKNVSISFCYSLCVSSKPAWMNSRYIDASPVTSFNKCKIEFSGAMATIHLATVDDYSCL